MDVINFGIAAVTTAATIAADDKLVICDVSVRETEGDRTGGFETVTVAELSHAVLDNLPAGAADTGWTAATGTAQKGTFAVPASYTVGGSYAQAEVQAIAADLVKALAHIKAIEDLLRSKNIIGA